MKRAIVVGASGGIGGALVGALRSGGWDVVALSRRGQGFDVTDEASVAAPLAAQEGAFDLVICATGGLEIGAHRPEKSLRALDPAAFAAQFALNAMGPLLVLKHALRLMPRDRASHFVALSARVGSIGDNHLGGWYSYRAAKAALNQLIHTAAIEIARSHPMAVVASLHPGTVATALTDAYRGTHASLTPDEAAGHLLSVIAQLTPAQSGGFYDWQGKEVVW